MSAKGSKRPRESTSDTLREINASSATGPLDPTNTLSKFKSLATQIWESDDNGSPKLEQQLKLAAAFLLGCTIQTSTNNTFRIVEAEAYFHGAVTHRDTFTHGFPEQGTVGEWYFHRVNPTGGFKGGTFKGMDVTFGNAAKGHYGGFLIRSIQPTGTSKLIEGPSLVVDALLSSSKCPSVNEFVSTRKVVCVASSPMTLSYQPTACDASDVVCASPRVGLVPRKPTDLVYVARPYRFHVVNPSSTPPLSKLRSGIVAALLATGIDSGDAQRMAGAQKQLIEKVAPLVALSQAEKSNLNVAISEAIAAEKALPSDTSKESTSKSAAATDAGNVTRSVFSSLDDKTKKCLQIVKDVLGEDVKQTPVISKLVAIASALNQY